MKISDVILPAIAVVIRDLASAHIGGDLFLPVRKQIGHLIPVAEVISLFPRTDKRPPSALAAQTGISHRSLKPGNLQISACKPAGDSAGRLRPGPAHGSGDPHVVDPGIFLHADDAAHYALSPDSRGVIVPCRHLSVHNDAVPGQAGDSSHCGISFFAV